MDQFEKEFARVTGSAHAVALQSGTAALHIALRMLGVGPGDEVVVPSLTFIGTVNPILYQGARPIFLDSEEKSWNMDPDLLEALLKKKGSKKIKAVIPVPARAPTGLYDVEVALLSDSVRLASQSTHFEVIKIGFEKDVAEAARLHGWLYGFAALLMAGLFGWLATIIFRRD